MTNASVTVRNFIRDTFFVRDAHTLPSDASLLDLGVVDSTGVLELTAFLEGHFEIEIIDTEILAENLDSIERIVAFVHRKRAERRPAIERITRELELRFA